MDSVEIVGFVFVGFVTFGGMEQRAETRRVFRVIGLGVRSGVVL